MRLRLRRGEADTEQRSRRRFARRQWARRWHVWRRLLLALGLVAAVGAGVWLLFFSATLSVQTVTVQGEDLLTAAEVREAAGVTTGEQVISVDLEATRRRVEALAAVRSAQVHRQWPDGVLIQVEERDAIAVVDLGSGLRGMDEEGVVFREFAKPPEGMPRVRVLPGADQDALREAAQVVAALPPALTRRVERVEVESVDQIELVLHDGRVVLWGSAEASEEKAAVLTALLKGRPAQRYDVSVPGQPVTSG